MNQTHLVFGYGTLQHYANMQDYDSQLRYLRAEYVGDGMVLDRSLARLGRWAAMVPHYGGRVFGEVWCVDDRALRALDFREGYYPRYPEESQYRRVMVPVILRNGQTVEAYAYTTTHNPLTKYSKLTESWPQEGDYLYGEIRSHDPRTWR